MEEILMYYQKIYENPWLFSAVVAVILSFAVIIAGVCIHYIGEAIALLVGLFVDPRIVYVTINYVFFPGVMIHECAHALFAVLTGAKVTEVVLF